MFKAREKEGPKQDVTELNDKLAAAGLAWEVRNRDTYMVYNDAGTNRSIRFVLKVQDTAEKLYSASFVMHLAPPAGIYDAVFDFGSEASQIAVRKRSDEFDKKRRIDLLGRLYRDFYHPALYRSDGRVTQGEMTREDHESHARGEFYRQRFTAHNDEQSKKAKELFMSSFFVRRQYQCDDAPERPFDIDDVLVRKPFEEGDEEWVSLTGDLVGGPRYIGNEQKDGYEMVSNLKLAELEIARDFSLCVNGVEKDITDKEMQEEIFRRLMSQFLHLLLSELENTLRPQSGKLLKITLLVPNIYSQQRVNDLVRNVYTDLQRMLEKYEYDYRGFEIQTLSESDASFLGLLSNAALPDFNWHTLNRNGNYLVIDSGKGTTDLSVISVGDDNQLGSMFRAGRRSPQILAANVSKKA
ncbi:MAG: hypothetical protein AAF570_20070 [Bacteroidota bacterium]